MHGEIVREVKEVVVVAENMPGVLHSVAKDIAGSGINIDSINAYAIGDFAVFRLLTPDVYTTSKILERNKFVREVRLEDALLLKLPDKPGELAKITEKLYKRGVDLETVYISNKYDGITEVVVKPTRGHYEKAKEALREMGLKE